MNNNFGKIAKNTVFCTLCGAIMVSTMTGYVCSNSACPDLLLEKHEHVPEKGDIDVFGNILTRPYLIGTATSSATGSAMSLSGSNYYVWGKNKGGDG